MDTSPKDNTISKIEKIIKSKKTTLINNSSYKDSFDYISSKFPSSNVEEAKVYISEREFLEKMGYEGVGGFYSRNEKVIIIPDNFDFKSKENIWSSIKAKISIDEVLVHELLHYVSHKYKQSLLSKEAEEEFAYGNSIDYLKSKKYSDDYIIRYNFLPYLISTININSIIYNILKENMTDLEIKNSISKNFKTVVKKNEKKIFNLVVEEAYKKGENIISIYSEKDRELKLQESQILLDL